MAKELIGKLARPVTVKRGWLVKSARVPMVQAAPPNRRILNDNKLPKKLPKKTVQEETP